jgi:presenilin-like A22 family membrane protease
VSVALLSAVFLVYTIFDSAAALEHEQQLVRNEVQIESPANSEVIRSFIHTAYLLGTFGFLFILIFTKETAPLSRLVLISISLLVTVFATWLCEVIAVTFRLWIDSIVPSMAMSAIHATGAALALFFLRSNSGPEYTHLESDPPGHADESIDQ